MKPIAQSFCREPSGIQGIVTTSCLEADVESMIGSVMDSCIVNVPVVCERQTIVSHCVIDDPIIQVIPSCWMFHTAAVKQENSVLYVTIAFRIDDDLKGRVEQSRGWKGTTLEHPTSTLWQARLFPGLGTMSQSFTATSYDATSRKCPAQDKLPCVVHKVFLQLVYIGVLRFRRLFRCIHQTRHVHVTHLTILEHFA